MALRNQLTASNEEKTDDEWKKWDKQQEKKSRNKT